MGLISNFPLHISHGLMFFFSLSALVLAFEGDWWSDPDRKPHHGDGWSDKPRFPGAIGSCPFCVRGGFPHDLELFIHIRDDHTNLPPRYTCDEPCVYGSSKWGNFIRHYKDCKHVVRHEELPSSSEEHSEDSDESSEDSDYYFMGSGL